MKFRLISRFGDGLGLAWRLQEAGHSVDFYVTEPASSRLYDGLLKRVDRWNKDLAPETIVLFDMTGLGKIADSMRAAGRQVYGGGALNDQLELDREFARHLARTCGLRTPNVETYEDAIEAIGELHGKQGGWVYRPVASTPAPFIYVADTTLEMRIMLEHFARSSQGKFTLEPKLSGVEVSIECWYVRGRPLLQTINSTVEVTRFLAGGLGPQTGCMGSVAWFWKNPTNKLYRMTHEKVQPFLRRYEYDGPLNIQVVIEADDKRPTFLGFQGRFGYNAIYAVAEDLGLPLADCLAALAAGREPDLAPSYQWCGALRITSPPFPYRIPDAFAGKPVVGLDGPHVWPLDVYQAEGKWVTAGGDGVVAELTARAPNVPALGAQLYGQAQSMILADKQYRTDVCSRAEADIDKLTDWKFIKPHGGSEHA